MEGGFKISLMSRELSFKFRMKNFVKDTDGWRRGFIFITAEDGQLKIGHDMGSRTIRLTNIEFDDVDEWIKYFDRI